MTFDELDSRMRKFETEQEQFARHESILVARLDGRSFTRLTSEVLPFTKPFDVRFRDCMIDAAKCAMTCGFECLFGYTQSDEISLLFALQEMCFGRSLRKWTSILAGETSSCFSRAANIQSSFDCRIIELPSLEIAVDYFRWRNEDAHRNCLTGWCYWRLRAKGVSPKEAAAHLHCMSGSDKVKMLQGEGIEYDSLPSWQRRGIGLFWESFEKPSVNPLKNTAVVATRRRLAIELELPMGDELSTYLTKLF